MPLLSLAEYEALAEAAHGHLCAGQVLGLRMALYGVRLLGLDDPAGKDRGRLITIVEIDRCATDAIPIVTGCRLGRRTLKFRDFGKMAATFHDLERGRGVRLVARDSARLRARELCPGVAEGRLQQLHAYRQMPDGEMFASSWVRVLLAPRELPGFRAPRVACESCGESVTLQREVLGGGRVLCRACAGECYYEPL